MAGENNNNNNNGGGRGVDWVSSFSRFILLYLAFSFFFRQPAQKQPLEEGVEVGGGEVGVVEKKGELFYSNHFSFGDVIKSRVYLSEEEGFHEGDESLQHWEKNMIFGQEYNWVETTTVTTSPSLQNNGSLYVHVFYHKEGGMKGGEEREGGEGEERVFHSLFRLNVYEEVQEEKEKKFLLNSFGGQVEVEVEEKKEEEEKEVKEVEIGSFWAENYTLVLVNDETKYRKNILPEAVKKEMVFEEEEGKGKYIPVYFFNKFWHISESFSRINSTTKTLPLRLELGTTTTFMWQFYLQMQESMNFQLTMGSSKKDIDNTKKMLVETNPYLLGVTAIVTLLHTVFDFLAFKNDISFWKNKKSMEGVSTRSMALRTFNQFIIFLYLMDNETSWMISISAGIGVVIDVWKLTKVFDVVRSGKFPFFHFKDKQSYVSKTKEYDEQAMKYLSYVLYPLIFCYAVYSLMYNTHKSWYSFILSTLTGCVYTFGFIMMTPQIFINYKLKSVAHLPWRQLTYKFLNTIIDDLFAFIITMPLLHRIACFRDDVVFFICLYQRYIYPVDEKRINEFGGGGEGDEEEEGEEGKEGKKGEKEAKGKEEGGKEKTE